MKEKITQMLDEKINEVFYDLQTEYGIESGDVEPFDAVWLDKYTEQLAEHIEKIILWEMTWCK